jgi:hypothetical protein|tara:strand:+ start:12621 stop:12959 length:339 start_codon:yes stop_codon:yes gene_type:complete
MAVNPVFNISIPQGSDFSETFVSTESDGSLSNLAGYTGAAILKKHPGATTSTSFSVSIVSGVGEVSIAMTSGTTVGLTPGRHVYDVRLVSPSGAVSRLVEGMAFVTAGITTN